MAVIQFLLGVDAPVSWLLIQQIVLQVLVNCLIALPVYEVVRRLLYRGAAARPACTAGAARTRLRSARCSGPLSGSAAVAQGEGTLMLGPLTSAPRR